MGRPRNTWTDNQLRAIIVALPALDRDYPINNACFLDGLIAEVRAVTGRVFGATTYSRLLRDVAPQAGVSRHPSAPTIHQAILRAQALAPIGQPSDAQTRLLDLDLIRHALAPLIREAVAPLHSMLHEQRSDGSEVARPAGVAAQTTTLLHAALEDAHARIRRLEQDNAMLNQVLGETKAARDLAGEHVNRLLAELHATIERSGAGAATLARTAQQLAGTERFLKMQNDAVRLQASTEADALRVQNGQLRERIDHLLLENDQYRRTLAGRPRGEGAER